MSPRIVGIDSYSPLTRDLASQALAAMGQAPAFWGRYFTAPDTKSGAEYRHALEGPIAADLNIRILPIARQTNNVSGGAALGRLDGTSNARDLAGSFGLEVLGAMPGVRIFLDVEGSGVSHLSAFYYMGWVEGLLSVLPNALPCVYGIPGDQQTWSSLRSAVNNGLECHGLWLSRPFVHLSEPVEWNPTYLPIPSEVCPSLIWQYEFGRFFDRDVLNPELADASRFLATLPLPDPLFK